MTAIIAQTDHVRPRTDFTVSLSATTRSSRRGSELPGATGVTRVRCTGAGAGAGAAEAACGCAAAGLVAAEGDEDAAGFGPVVAVGVRWTSVPSVG